MAIPAETLTIRRADDGDDDALRRLADLDGAQPPRGEMLTAELDGEPVAAVPLSGGRAIADPFRPTADIVNLLEYRAAQVRRRARRQRRRKPGR